MCVVRRKGGSRGRRRGWVVAGRGEDFVVTRGTAASARRPAASGGVRPSKGEEVGSRVSLGRGDASTRRSARRTAAIVPNSVILSVGRRARWGEGGLWRRDRGEGWSARRACRETNENRREIVTEKQPKPPRDRKGGIDEPPRDHKGGKIRNGRAIVKETKTNRPRDRRGPLDAERSPPPASREGSAACQRSGVGWMRSPKTKRNETTRNERSRPPRHGHLDAEREVAAARRALARAQHVAAESLRPVRRDDLER